MAKHQNEKLVVTQQELNEDEEPPSKRPFISEEEILTTYLQNKIERDKTCISPRSADFLHHYFPEASEKDWCNWHWQLKNSVTTLEQLSRFLRLSENEIRPKTGVNDSLPVRITPYYLSLLDKYNTEQPLRKSAVPVFDEFITSPGEASDPLSEGHHSPVPNLVHRYPDRVLFLATGFCSTYCRYCTRSHMVAKDKCHVGTKAWEPALQYIEQNPVVRDVLISGGDPLTLPDMQIEYLLSRLRAIEHVEIIRIGTKVPAVLPQRITKPLLNLLRKYHPLYLSIHFTHPDEITPEVKEACEKLANAGIPLGSQTVLLKGVNDEVATMKKLMHLLLMIRVRPYYLYQCDPILGSAHFRTTVEKGLEIIRGLRGHTSGYAVPQYVIDAPGGGGKIPLLPDYTQGREENYVLLKNYEGKVFRYPDFSH
ncbi:MAG TPA: KamA family radical SAM protein [Bacteroidales bacterium]|nr:KamA family radical SAM protein [Bacteroidales bacterium]